VESASSRRKARKKNKQRFGTRRTRKCRGREGGNIGGEKRRQQGGHRGTFKVLLIPPRL